MEFRNNDSHCKFIGNRNLEEVIKEDQKELIEIGEVLMKSLKK